MINWQFAFNLHLEIKTEKQSRHQKKLNNDKNSRSNLSLWFIMLVVVFVLMFAAFFVVTLLHQGHYKEATDVVIRSLSFGFFKK